MMFPIHDFLDAVLLGAFFFGLIFTVAALLLGFADIGAHGDTGGHDVGHGHGFAGHDIVGGLLNVTSILAFITWFGGISYLLRTGFGVLGVVAVLIGIAGGFLAAFAVSWFMVRVLRPGNSELDPHDYETIGVIARVSSSIRQGGFGEIVYELGGTRQVGTAQSVDAEPIGRGTEVIVLRIERGVAIVDTVEHLMDDRMPA